MDVFPSGAHRERLQNARQAPYSYGMLARKRAPWSGEALALGIAAGLGMLPACGAPVGSEPAGSEPEEAVPAVIRTVPSDGDVDVDAELEALSVTFSESMEPEGWSWVTEAGRSAPSVTGIPFYVDELTNVLPVRLQAHTSYVVWVNSPHDTGLRKFTSEDGVSVPAYRIRFRTR